MLQGLITKSITEGKTLYCAFIDLQKAFNSIYRQGLWYKLITAGCGGKMLHIIHDLYSKVKCCVRVHGGVLTDVFLTLLGLQQGAILSPYLFAFYLNDLLDILIESNPQGGVTVGNCRISILLYADDMVVMSNTRQGLQQSLDTMCQYFTRWKLKVNIGKSNVLVCKARGAPGPNDVWFYDGDNLAVCDAYNYLGITLTGKGITNKSLDVLANQAKKSLAGLQTNLCNIGNFPPAVSLRLFHVSISPILCYGAEVWGYMKGDKMQVILNRWCKRILGVKVSTPNSAVAGELGQYPLIIVRKLLMLKYWIKIINGPHNMYRYSVYQYLKNNIVVNRTCKNWSKEVRSILIQIGREGAWHSDTIDTNTEQFIVYAKQTLIDIYTNEWRRELETKEKMQTYNMFKTIFQHEMYLSNIKSVNVRTALTRIRLSSHNLAIETGRYHPRVERHRRFCAQCNTQDIEDEYHFVCICTKYTDLRNRYLPRYYRTHCSMAKYIQLMSDIQENHNLCNNVAMFVWKATKDRL